MIQGVINVFSSTSSTISPEEAADEPSGANKAALELSKKDFKPSYKKYEDSTPTTSRDQELVPLTMLYTLRPPPKTCSRPPGSV